MKKSYFLAGTAILFWSTVATVSKLLLGTLNNFQLLWASSFFAGMFLLVVNILTKNIKKLKGYTLKDYIISACIGFPGAFMYYAFYYMGTDILPASQAFIINYMWPIMSVVFAWIILKEKMTLKKGVAIFISFLGVGIVTGGEISNFSHDMLFGAVCCLLGAASYGIFTALNQKFSYDKPISMMINYFVTFTVTTIINLINGNLFIPSGIEALGFAWNGIFTIAVANTAWTMALESGKTAKISNLAYITPFMSLVWTSLILKEQISVYSILGLFVIILGILIQLKDKSKTEK